MFHAEARRVGSQALRRRRRRSLAPAATYRRAPSGIDVATGARIRVHVKTPAEVFEEFQAAALARARAEKATVAA